MKPLPILNGLAGILYIERAAAREMREGWVGSNNRGGVLLSSFHVWAASPLRRFPVRQGRMKNRLCRTLRFAQGDRAERPSQPAGAKAEADDLVGPRLKAHPAVLQRRLRQEGFVHCDQFGPFEGLR
jgi:hypothetical protein